MFNIFEYKIFLSIAQGTSVSGENAIKIQVKNNWFNI